MASSEAQITHNWTVNGIDSTIIGGSGTPYSIAQDANRNIYICGYFTYSSDLDPSSGVNRVYSNGSTDTYIAKYDSLGNFIYARSYGGPGVDVPYCMSVTAGGVVYLCGTFADTVDFDPGAGVFNLVSSTVGTDNYILKLDANGNFLDAKLIRLGLTGKINSCTVETSGLYICGAVTPNNDFDPGSGVASSTVTGSSDFFYAVYDYSLNYVSHQSFGGTGSDRANGIYLNSSNVILIGAFEGTAYFNTAATQSLVSWGGTDIFLAAYDINTGAFYRCTRLGGTGNDEGYNIDGDFYQDIYYCGKVAGNNIDLDASAAGNTFLTSAGGDDICFGVWDVALNSGGGYKVGGTGNDCATDLDVCDIMYSDQYTICGYFSATVDFDVSVSTLNRTASNNGDFFIATYGNNNPFQCVGVVVCQGIGYETLREISIGANRHIYTAGTHSTGVDLDPNSGVVTPSNPSYGVFLGSYSTLGGYRWSKTFGINDTLTRKQEVRKVVRDANNNTYVCGLFQGVVDMDPGPGVYNLRTALPYYQYDFFFAKYDPNGNLLWAHKIGGNVNEEAGGIALDAAGNVYIAGAFYGTVDFDPGPGVNTLFTTSAARDVFFAKYDNNGNFIMAQTFGISLKNETCRDITVDASGNICLIGEFENTVDFDPGSGTTNLVSAGNKDIYLAKYSTSGTFVFAKRFGTVTAETGYAIDVDQYNNIYIGGEFSNIVDFDPGAGTANLSASTYGSAFYAKYTSAGAYVYAKAILSSNNGSAEIYDIAVDSRCRIVVTGMCANTTDFDPSAATVNLISAYGIATPFVAGYDSLGAYRYARIIYTSNDGISWAVDVDDAGAAYIGGYFKNTANFNFGSGTYNLVSNYDDDGFVAKYDLNGTFIYAFNIGGNEKDWVYTVSTNSTGGNITAGGYFNIKVDFDPSINTYVLSGSNSNDLFVSNYTAPCSGPVISGSIAGSTTLCENTSATYSIPTVPGATGYTWTLPSGWTGTSNSNSITAVAGTTGTISVTANNSCGASSPLSLAVTVNAAPILTTTVSPSTTVCAGTAVTLTANGANTYSWTGSITNGVPFTASTSQTYTVTGTGSNSCQSTTTVSLTVNPLPVAASTVSPGNIICTGSPITLTGTTPAVSYSWSGGVVNGVAFVPVSTQTYTLTVTDGNMCTDTMQVSVNVQNVPVVTVSTTPDTIVCSGTTTTLTANGAISYTWSNSVTNGVPFNPLTTTTYTVVGSNAPGCEDTVTVTVYVNPLPSVSYIELMDTVCMTAASFSLSPGNPAGGVYSGPGVAGNTFNPGLAGPGSHQIVYTYADSNLCNSTAVSTVFVDVCTNVNSVNSSGFLISPNPAEDQIRIELNNAIISGTDLLHYVIYNSNGQIAAAGRLNGAVTFIPVSTLAAGVYQLQIVGNSNVNSMRFIKK